MTLHLNAQLNELEGDYLRRHGRMFLTLAFSLGVLNLLWFFFFKNLWPLMQNGWRIYVYILTTVLLPTALAFSLIGAWSNFLHSLRFPRKAASHLSELLLLTSGFVLLFFFMAYAFHLAVDGLSTGVVKLIRGHANITSDPAPYWFGELFLFASVVASIYGIWKYNKMLTHLLRAPNATLRFPGAH